MNKNFKKEFEKKIILVLYENSQSEVFCMHFENKKIYSGDPIRGGPF